MNEKYLAMSIVGTLAVMVLSIGGFIGYRLMSKGKTEEMGWVLGASAFLVLFLALIVGAIIEGNVT